MLHHGRAQVAFESYQDLLERAALLLPRRCTVISLAARGCAATELMAHLQRLGWHGRIRIKRSLWLYHRGRPRCKVERLAVARGPACFWQQGYITKSGMAPYLWLWLKAGKAKTLGMC